MKKKSIKSSPLYIVISPVRDEMPYVENTLKSILNQTIKPLLWIIVNDGSTDGTGEFLENNSKGIRWIKVIHRENRGYRAAGGGVVEAFNDGYSFTLGRKWDYLVKLDGDLSFDQDYFERCFNYFDKEPLLGLAGGTVCVLENGNLRVDAAGDPPFHVRGASKIYRRECWEKIKPLAQAPGWDTIDEVKANYYGWITRTFEDLKIIQHKPTGGADGHWRNWLKNGLANYNTGYHPLFMMAKCFKRTFQKPIFIASLALLIGFCKGYIKDIPKIRDREIICYFRRQQIRRLLLLPSIYR